MSAEPAKSPALRASDADREQAVTALGGHAAEGRLSVDELDERTHAAYAARTLPELNALLADLPADAVAAAQPTPEEDEVRDSFREHLVAYVLVNLLLIGIWAATGAGYFWPIFPLLGWGVAVGLDYAGTRQDARRLRRASDPAERAAIVARNARRRQSHGMAGHGLRAPRPPRPPAPPGPPAPPRHRS